MIVTFVAFKIHANVFQAGALPWTVLREVMMLSQIPSLLRRENPSQYFCLELPLIGNCALSFNYIIESLSESLPSVPLSLIGRFVLVPETDNRRFHV